MRAAFHTFGCKLNQYESESLARAFRDDGWQVVRWDQAADCYVVNTCTVTSKAEQKARRLIRRLCRDRGNSVILVTGCYAQLEREAVEGLGDNVVCLPQEDKHLLQRRVGDLRRVLEAGGASVSLSARSVDAFVRGAARGEDPDPFCYTSGGAAPRTPLRTPLRTRPFLKIQDGCDYSCAYCRIPLARGPSVSRPVPSLLKECRELESLGHREIVITGVNITDYRSEHGSEGLDFPGLLRLLLQSTRVPRFRLSSLEPERVGEDLLDVMTDGRICPHFHVPIQSGSDHILGAMRRRYDSARCTRVLERLWQVRDQPFVGADVILGFPDESDADFARTLGLLESVPLAGVHAFPFSPRPGTAAIGLPNRVPERVRDERVREVLSLAERMHTAYVDRWLGRMVDVLVEGSSPAGGQGLSQNYLRIQVDPASPVGPGKLIAVQLRREDGVLRGKPSAEDEE